MQQYNCPSCGAELRFQSSVSISCVCSYCRNLAVRRDKDVESIGKMAELPDDMSPFQIGTGGKFKGLSFSLIGRMKIGWEDGCWNEWFLFADDGRKGWMAEAQGSLAISFEIEEKQAPDNFPELGHFVNLDGKPFTVTDIKETECIGSEGELPIIAPRGRKARTVDLANRQGGFASMEYHAPDPIRIYVGEYAEFDNLQFTGLRELPGWKIQAVIQTKDSKRKKSNGGW
jgi:hypothetical protein